MTDRTDTIDKLIAAIEDPHRLVDLSPLAGKSARAFDFLALCRLVAPLLADAGRTDHDSAQTATAMDAEIVALRAAATTDAELLAVVKRDREDWRIRSASHAADAATWQRKTVGHRAEIESINAGWRTDRTVIATLQAERDQWKATALALTAEIEGRGRAADPTIAALNRICDGLRAKVTALEADRDRAHDARIEAQNPGIDMDKVRADRAARRAALAALDPVAPTVGEPVACKWCKCGAVAPDALGANGRCRYCGEFWPAPIAAPSKAPTSCATPSCVGPADHGDDHWPAPPTRTAPAAPAVGQGGARRFRIDGVTVDHETGARTTHPTAIVELTDPAPKYHDDDLTDDEVYIEHAYWEFDAHRADRNRGPYLTGSPMEERDAFKAQLRAAIKRSSDLAQPATPAPAPEVMTVGAAPCSVSDCKVAYWRGVLERKAWRGKARDAADARASLSSAELACDVHHRTAPLAPPRPRVGAEVRATIEGTIHSVINSHGLTYQIGVCYESGRRDTIWVDAANVEPIGAGGKAGR